MKTKTLGIVIVVAVVAVAAVLVVRRASSSGTASASAYEGQVIEPGAFAVADYAGKPLVVNFFGSWCPPCNAEAADLAPVRAVRTRRPGRRRRVRGHAEDAAEDFMARVRPHVSAGRRRRQPQLPVRRRGIPDDDLLRRQGQGSRPPRRRVHPGPVQRLAGQGAVTRAATC